MEQRPQAICLSDAEFIESLKSPFIDSLEILPWQKSMGARDRLNLVQNASITAIFVDLGLAYSPDSIICWGAALMPKGKLYLEKSPYLNPHMLVKSFDLIFDFVHEPELTNCWVFQKKPVPNFDTLQQNVAQQLINHESTDNRVYNALNQLEQSYPYSIIGPYVTSQILNTHGFLGVASRNWLDFCTRNPAPNMHYFGVLHRINSGDYYQGFQEREYFFGHLHQRRSKKPPKEEWQEKRWFGEAVNGKHIVIWSEFGLGDEIMFAQLAHYFKTQGAQVSLIAQSPIVTLLQTHPDLDQVIALDEIDEKLTDFDYWVYPHSILAHIDLPFKDIPKRLPYLFATQASKDKWSKQIQDKRLKVGLVWRGSPTHENDSFRSIHDLSQIEQLLAHQEYAWYCLQKELNEEEQALMARYNVPLIGRHCEDFQDTAGALSQLDIVVAVDTSIAHLAGAMNVPTLLMLPFVMDWRWGFERRNLWYSSLRTIRQRTPLTYWPQVINQVLADLQQFSETKTLP